jgi:lipopolysaccharide cholinephosphotransferase
MIQILILFIILLIILIFIICTKYKNESFTNYNGFEYSDKLSIQNIKDLKAGQKIMTNMFKEFNRICIKYNLKYWCFGGTLIGVLRHNGWVPWDGDIDVCMLEEDYNTLKGIIQKELPKDMWFQNSSTDKNFVRPPGNKNYLPAKIRHLYSCYNKCQDGLRWHNGLQLDIFIYKKKNNILIPPGYFNDLKQYNVDMIFPLKKVIFDNIYVYIPNKYKKYSILNWKKYPPPIIPINKRYPHEGIIKPNNICPHHYLLYPELYK